MFLDHQCWYEAARPGIDQRAGTVGLAPRAVAEAWRQPTKLSSMIRSFASADQRRRRPTSRHPPPRVAEPAHLSHAYQSAPRSSPPQGGLHRRVTAAPGQPHLVARAVLNASASLWTCWRLGRDPSCGLSETEVQAIGIDPLLDDRGGSERLGATGRARKAAALIGANVSVNRPAPTRCPQCRLVQTHSGPTTTIAAIRGGRPCV